MGPTFFRVEPIFKNTFIGKFIDISMTTFNQINGRAKVSKYIVIIYFAYAFGQL
jgi:hypothetical protein